ncbi:ribonuclease P protein subunit p30 [Lethenteron reissneri]|uniref:ribonuclease P protein subunit p30 n=1 Tax=Lethenteron reissneri TaxID=7753 RepID=UPI002AB6BE01|nr:ribonuclease P protein subunit p30 [Lethenteron reissneri]
MSAELNLTGGANAKPQHLQSVVEAAARLGYSTVAITTVVDLSVKGQEIKRPQIPQFLLENPPKVQGSGKPLKILTRLTAIITDPSHGNKMRTGLECYDIIAVMPKSEKVFHMACMDLDVDIIVIDGTERQPFYFRHPSVRGAIARGVFFELSYSPAVRDAAARRSTISNALSLTLVCKGKNVIISSGTDNPLYLRGPYDVANLALLFGLSESEGKNAVSSNCRAVIIHAKTRKMAKGVILTERLGDPGGGEKDAKSTMEAKRGADEVEEVAAAVAKDEGVEEGPAKKKSRKK